MWEATSTWHCQACDQQLRHKDDECWSCWSRLYREALKEALTEIAPNHPILQKGNFKIEWNDEEGRYIRVGTTATGIGA